MWILKFNRQSFRGQWIDVWISNMLQESLYEKKKIYVMYVWMLNIEYEIIKCTVDEQVSTRPMKEIN